MNFVNTHPLAATRELFGHLHRLGGYLPQLGLRFLLAYEFWESGVEKFHGENWFADIQERFPFPFDLVPVDISWFLATWSELLGAVALVIGPGTRWSLIQLQRLLPSALSRCFTAPWNVSHDMADAWW